MTTIFQPSRFENDKIAALWKLYCMIRTLNEVPQIWKLTDPFLDALAEFLHVPERDSVLCASFLDASVDATTGDPRLICVQGVYPLFVAMH